MAYQVNIIPEDVASSDGRSYPAGVLTWRETIPLMFSDATTLGHEGAIFAGNITNLRRATIDGETWIVGDLAYDTDNEAVEAERMAREGKIPGVSADVAEVWDETGGIDADGFPEFVRTSAEIVGATQVTMPAFATARILTVEAAPILASASDALSMAEPPDDDPRYVTQPNGEIAIPLTIEGRRVYGHAGVAGQCHTGFIGKCVSPPVSQTGYALFHTNLIDDVPTGTAVWRADHAPATVRMRAEDARDHYAHHAYAWADVRASDGVHGPWIAGVLRDDVTDEEVSILQRSTWSGDWRRGELVGLLTVNQSAFPVAREVIAASVSMLNGEVVSQLGVGRVYRRDEVEVIMASADEDLGEKPDLGLLLAELAALNAKVDSLLPAEEEEVVEVDEPTTAGLIANLLDK